MARLAKPGASSCGAGSGATRGGLAANYSEALRAATLVRNPWVATRPSTPGLAAAGGLEAVGSVLATSPLPPVCSRSVSLALRGGPLLLTTAWVSTKAPKRTTSRRTRATSRQRPKPRATSRRRRPL